MVDSRSDIFSAYNNLIFQNYIQKRRSAYGRKSVRISAAFFITRSIHAKAVVAALLMLTEGFSPVSVYKWKVLPLGTGLSGGQNSDMIMKNMILKKHYRWW